ncbi:Arc family DNA-binding protein [Streptomyces coeruleorubidus]|uniref:Arc family DNA-binding protein n=1 Tax=Streptomyces coeruleorubidus TaxID=116188 RepID=UPI00237FCB80|nr:Arc family DNA-binding protein [Streptomyces coeruleorubidus]WDV55256.1 Arc family DNA-binding protein [Streptomyces coeruleorubidus]
MAIFNFRIPDDLYAKLKDLAASEERSVNSELLHLVRRAVESGGVPNRLESDSATSAPLRDSRHSPRP